MVININRENKAWIRKTERKKANPRNKQTVSNVDVKRTTQPHRDR